MVFYFTSKTVDPPASIYMGENKFVNEDLIRYGLDQDVWFHVDNLSSAHVYLRLQDGADWGAIHPDLLVDCAQLTKANSIEGNKKDNITVIYTPWSNLKKSGDMATGQVSFHKQKAVKKVFVPTRINEIVNRLNKTKVERQPDLAIEKRDDDVRKQRATRATYIANVRIHSDQRKPLSLKSIEKGSGKSSERTKGQGRNKEARLW